jgi:hypothetical protein
MITRPLAKILKRLSEQGEMPASDLSDTHREALNALFQTEVLHDIRKGRGYSVTINKPEAFSAFVAKHCPDGLPCIDMSPLSRSEGVAKYRNSKQGRLTSEVVIVSAKPGHVLTRRSGQLAVGHLTEVAGVASFVLEEDASDDWQFSGRIATVENYASFVQWHRMGIQAEMAIWTAGRLSDRMIHWFKGLAVAGCTFVHSGDYDPVGMNEFLRLKDQLPDDQVTLHIPNNIDSLFDRYANQSLLANPNAAGLLKSLRTSKDPQVRKILQLMSQANGGLEQEILLHF